MPQRAIAARTGLNLAKVNFVLRALVDKGFIKLKRVRDNPHKLRYLYLLTPEGIAEKSRLTYRFMQRVIHQYNQAEQQIEQSLRRLRAQGIRRVVLWGNNGISELCLRVLEALSDQLNLVGVVDPSGKSAHALKPSQVAALDVDAVVLCDTGGDGNGGGPAPDLMKQLPPNLKIWKLL